MTAVSSLFTFYPSEDYHRRSGAVQEAVGAVLHRGNYILGAEVDLFEKEWAAWCGAAEAVGVANGTDAVELLLRGLGIGPGDAVVVPSHTAAASVSGIRRAGADPVYADIDPGTFTLDPASLEQALAGPAGARVKAVLAVHLYGHPADMDALAAVCQARGVVLLEDGAQAHGAVWQGRRAGSLAAGAAFSFYPTKNLGALGDGGAVTTNDPALAARIREIRQYGWRERYVSAVEGINSRLDEMQAAILRVKLRDLDASLARREALAGRYYAALERNPLILPPQVRPGASHAWHLYVVRCGKRNSLLRYLLDRGIPAALHYPAAVHQQPGYAAFAAQSPALPATEEAVRSILTLPLHPWLSGAAVELVIDALAEWTQRA